MSLRASFGLFWILFAFAICKKINFQSAGNEEFAYRNGPGGDCELDASKTEVICTNRWIKNQTTRTDKKTVKDKRGCQYYRKSIVYECYGTDRGKDGLVACFRDVSRYLITPLCGGTWLKWTPCDKTCGGGTTMRVKFTRTKNGDGTTDPKYEKTTEYRPCNVMDCPRWSDWEPIRTVNESSEQCNVTTCTKLLTRSCIFNNTAASPMLCAKNVLSNESAEYESLLRQEVPCRENECGDSATTASYPETAADKAAVGVPVRERASLENGARASTSEMTFTVAVMYNAIAPLQESNLWQGFGIGFVVAMALCFVVAIFVYKRFVQKKARSTKSRAFSMPMSHSIRYAGSLHSRPVVLGGTMASGSYLQPDTRLTPPSIPPTLRTGETFSSINEEGIYWMVPSKENAQAQPKNADSSKSSGSAVDSATAQTAASAKSESQSDPLYSDIPAFSRNDGARRRYSSSEFDTSGAESDGERASMQPLSSGTEKDASPIPMSFESKEDGCKSFDSDESRDVVRTLRKPSTKLKTKRPSLGRSDQGDVFLSEEDILKEDLDNERRSAFSVRYSKILAKRSRLARKTSSRKGNQPVETGFEWIEGRRLTSSTNSDIAPHSPSTPNMDPLLDATSGRKRPTLHRLSSGASSATSFNIDTTTSGYNSAFGDSTDDEYSMWSKRRMSSRLSLRDREPFPRRNLFNRDSRRSLKTNSLFASERRTEMWDILPRESTSLFDPRISRFIGDAHVTPKRMSPQVEPFRTARPSYQRSLSLVSRDGRIVPVEDIYSFPVDAEHDARESSSDVYDLPFDAQASTTVLS